MSANRLTTEVARDAWLVHDGPGGRVYELFESKADAVVAHRFYNRQHAPAEIKVIPLRVVVDEPRSPGRATFTPAPKLKLTRKWKVYFALLCTWVLGATTTLVAFFVGDELVEAIGGFVWNMSLLVLAGFIMRPPVQYKPIVEAKK